jgi:hypothetical protein
MAKMEKIKNDSFYIVLKGIVYLLTILALLFFANFWMGSKEGWEEIVENEFYPALITRTIFLTTIGLFCLLISYLLAVFYKKKYNYFKETIILILFSLIVNLYIMLF